MNPPQFISLFVMSFHIFFHIPFRGESEMGCRKTNLDATKVTYNMYSCAISGMSRETMEMDGRDSAEYQNW